MATRKRALGGEPCVALLRGVNVGGNKRVPMAQLRILAQRLGWAHVATYLQSGNLVFTGDGDAAADERQLEKAIELHFGFVVPVIVRTTTAWRTATTKGPFAAAAAERPKLVHLGFSKRPPKAGAGKALAPYCTAGERVVIQNGAIWVDYASGVARSKLTPAVLDRVVGSTVTLRNVTTVAAITELLAAAAGGPAR